MRVNYPYPDRTSAIIGSVDRRILRQPPADRARSKRALEVVPPASAVRRAVAMVATGPLVAPVNTRRVMQRAAAAALACLSLASPLVGQTLKGSSASVDRQHDVAVEHDFSFLDSTGEVRRFVNLGLLVQITGGRHYELGAVSFPYARPAVRTFIERLSGQYEASCGEPLVVTSLTRPVDKQPRNASELSVHPAGMAVDLRVSNRRSCRTWLEKTLLSLEKSGVIEATRERRPSHYHVAVFPNQYIAYVDQLEHKANVTLASSGGSAGTAAGDAPKNAAARTGTDESARTVVAANTGAGAGATAGAQDDAAAESGQDAPESPATSDYRVNRGDSLWSIARRVGTTVNELKQLNGLRSSRLVVGQMLVLPAGNQL
jgi:LysM repeat protein